MEYRKVLRHTIKQYNVVLSEKTKQCINNKRLFCYFDYIMEKKRNKLFEVITDELQTGKIKNIAVFGAGEIGNIVIMLLEKFDVKITVVDNDLNKHGMLLLGQTIKSPKELQELHQGIILIANYIYSDEILLQLQKSRLSDKIEILPFYIWTKQIILKVFGIMCEKNYA